VKRKYPLTNSRKEKKKKCEKINKFIKDTSFFSVATVEYTNTK
jgi:hypothetical protein